jgi:hypothetical protein
MNRENSVGIETGHWLDGRGSDPRQGQEIILYSTASGAHPALYSMCTGALSPGGKAAVV